MTLPSNWSQAPVKELFRVVGGGTPATAVPEYWQGSIPWISSADIDEEHRLALRRFISESAIKNSATNLVPRGSVIVVTRVGLGKVAIAPQPLCFSQDHQALIFSARDFNPNYVLLFMSTAVKVFRHISRGTTISGVTKGQLESLDFLLPPRPEQDRIVAEIEKQFTRLDDAVTALKRVQANLKRYRASVLKAACEGRLVPTEAELARKEGRTYEPASELLKRILAERRAKWEAEQLAKMRTAGKPPKNDDWKKKYKEPAPPDTSSLPPLPEAWLWVTLEQIAALEPNAITDGPFGSNLKSSHYTTEGPRVIRLQNIGDGEFRDARSHITAEHFARLLKHRVYPCDLVIAVLGERPPRSCIIPEGIGDAIVKADCVRFKPNAHAATSRYLNLVLNSEPLRRRTADVVHGVGRPRLNVGDIKALAIPLPPLVEQNRIAVYAERLFTDIDAALAVSETSAMRTRSLRQAILRRAFQGKLVPQDPADEPASVLLERIRADRAMGNNNIKRSARPRRTMRNTKAGVAR